MGGDGERRGWAAPIRAGSGETTGGWERPGGYQGPPPQPVAPTPSQPSRLGAQTAPVMALTTNLVLAVCRPWASSRSCFILTETLILGPSYRWENCSLKKLSHLLKSSWDLRPPHLAAAMLCQDCASAFYRLHLIHLSVLPVTMDSSHPCFLNGEATGRFMWLA